MQEAKQGCLLGCAGMATLLVVAAAGLLLYVATHREHWGRAVAAQVRAEVEAGTRLYFPEALSKESVERLGIAVEVGELSARPSKENLERLMEARAQVENPESTITKEWAEYLLVLMETLYEGRIPSDAVSDLRERMEASEFQTLNPEFIQKWIEDLIQSVQPSIETD